MSELTGNSWLDDKSLDVQAYDINSPFLNRAIAPNESMELEFVEVMKKERPDDTKIGSPGDTVYEFWFKDALGGERQVDQNGPKGMFFRAMRQAQVKEGETIKVSRTGEKMDTRWTIEKKVDGQWTNPVAETAPF